MRAQSAPPILESRGLCAFGGRVLRDLMHLRDGHEHPIAAGVAQVEIILRRAENGLGAQTEVLADPVHRMHDVVADAQVGQRDGHAFFDARAS